MNSRSSTDWTVYDRPEVRDRVLHVQDGLATAHLTVEGMHCGGCALKIEQRIGSLPGVTGVGVNAASKRMHVTWEAERLPFSHLLQAIADLGFTPRVPEPVAMQSTIDPWLMQKRAALKRLAVAGFGMAQVMSLAFALYAGAAHGMEAEVERYMRLVSMLVTVPVVFYSATPFFSAAWRDLTARRLGMDVPVSLAIALAFAASVFNTLRGSGEVYFDSVTMFVFILLLGRFVEMLTRHRSSSVSEALARILPESVQRLRDGRIELIALSDIAPGDRLLIPAGAAIPADGRIVEGSGTVDESLLTGESTPLLRKAGDPVLGGSLNLSNPLTVQVTAVGSKTTLASIVRLVERAQSERPRLGRVANKAAAWFVGGVLLLAAVVALLWMHFDPAQAFSATLAVLVVTCPCALSLATPAAIAAGTTRLARMGLLVTHADAVEALARARYCVFDKTGTLTRGAPRIAHIQSLSDRSADECLQLARALELSSEHSLAAAFAGPTPYRAENVRVVRGSGVEGEIAGVPYRIGQLAFVTEWLPQAGDTASLPDTRVYLADRTGVLAAFEIDDALRPEAADALANLQALGVECEIASGDHHEAVKRTAARLGIRRWSARLSPEAKLAHIEELNRRPGGVIMIGDGINDAPVLGAARVSVAMGSGSALAHASADSILMSQSLAVLPEAIRTARRTLRVIHQNLWWAAGYNLLAVPLAAMDAIPPWGAAIGMSLSSLIVVLNASRLARRRNDRNVPLTPATEAPA